MGEWVAANGGMVGLGVLAARYVLIIFSILSAGVMVERALTLKRVRAAEARDYRALRDAVRARQLETVRACAAGGASPVAAATQAGLNAADLGEAEMNDAIDQEVSMQSAELGRNLPMLGTVASVAPYVGLFGTVLGILDAFAKIAESGQTGAKVVAAPISEALIATALGLGVAIPAVVAYNYFSSRINSLNLQVEDHALEIAARLPRVLAPAQTAPAQTASAQTENG